MKPSKEYSSVIALEGADVACHRCRVLAGLVIVGALALGGIGIGYGLGYLSHLITFWWYF